MERLESKALPAIIVLFSRDLQFLNSWRPLEYAAIPKVPQLSSYLHVKACLNRAVVIADCSLRGLSDPVRIMLSGSLKQLHAKLLLMNATCVRRWASQH